MNQLYYGDNLEIMRKHITTESVDLCYIDPPFNSDADYNVTHKQTDKETAQVQAFKDTWEWDDAAAVAYQELMDMPTSLPNKTYLFIKSMVEIFGKCDITAYLIYMAFRINEIYRILKPTGSFYLHCDPTANYLLRALLDTIFVQNGGMFRNEIIWKRSLGHSISKGMDNITDTIFFYTKTKKISVNYIKELDKKEIDKKFSHTEEETGRKYAHFTLEKSSNKYNKNETRIIQGKEISTNLGWVWTQKTFDARLAKNPHLIYWTKNGKPRYKLYADEYVGKKINNLWDDILPLSSRARERLGYDTQKPEALLERIILSSSNEGDVVLDAYCGCGTTVAVAQRLNRKWIGIDITYNAVTLIKERLVNQYGKGILSEFTELGEPKDLKSAEQLALRAGDNRKEFEKWSIAKYSNNRAFVHNKKGGDGGIDGMAYMIEGKDETKKILFSVKSGEKLSPSVVRDLFGVVERENAAVGILITLYSFDNLVKEAKKYGFYKNPLTGNLYDKIQVVNIQEIMDGKRLDLPSIDIVKKAEYTGLGKQQTLEENK